MDTSKLTVTYPISIVEHKPKGSERVRERDKRDRETERGERDGKRDGERQGGRGEARRSWVTLVNIRTNPVDMYN